MRISVKGRYALAAMTLLAQNYQNKTPMTIGSIAEKLGISKIYLEQVFSLLKRAALVTSIKGAQGGYRLTSSPEETNVYAVLSAIELSLVEKTESTFAEKNAPLEEVLQNCIFFPIDTSLEATLRKISFALLAANLVECQKSENYMYFI